jgi:hypothetical protein
LAIRTKITRFNVQSSKSSRQEQNALPSLEPLKHPEF